MLITKQTDKVQETNPRSNFDPARIPFFSVSKEIIQYYKNKGKQKRELTQSKLNLGGVREREGERERWDTSFLGTYLV